MSFGFSVGDFLAVGNLAWQVYRSCEEAPESFCSLSEEVLSLHPLLKEVEEAYSQQTLTKGQKERLAAVRDGCQSCLKDLQSFIEKYESLGSQSKWTWDRMGWGFEQVGELRARLTSNITLLTAFISTSQYTVQKQLNKLLRDHQQNRAEGSVLSSQTVDSISKDEQMAWREIRKELQELGLSVSAFDTNKAFIFSWFRQAIASGAFEEQDTQVAPEAAGSQTPFPQSSSASEKQDPVSLSSRGARLSLLVRNWFQPSDSRCSLKISAPANPVHINHIEFNRDTQLYIGLPREWEDYLHRLEGKF